MHRTNLHSLFRLIVLAIAFHFENVVVVVLLFFRTQGLSLHNYCADFHLAEIMIITQIVSLGIS